MFIIYRVIPFLMVEIPILCLHHSLPIFFPGMILNHADCIRIIWKCTRDFFFQTKLWALLTETLCLQLLPTLSDFFYHESFFTMARMNMTLQYFIVLTVESYASVSTLVKRRITCCLWPLFFFTL